MLELYINPLDISIVELSNSLFASVVDPFSVNYLLYGYIFINVLYPLVYTAEEILASFSQ